MPFITELKFTVECEDCPTKATKEFNGGEFGSCIEEATEIVDFLFELERHRGWELDRISYEERKFYCPECKKKRSAE